MSHSLSLLLYVDFFHTDWMPIKDWKSSTKLFHFRSGRSERSNAAGEATESPARCFSRDEIEAHEKNHIISATKSA